MSLCDSLFYYIGYLATIVFLPKVIDLLVTILLRSRRRIELKANKDAYAIVTGSSDGIGLEYARQLAQRGFNLLLISRTESKLKNIQQEIVSKYRVKVEILSVDFTKIDIYDEIAKKIAALPSKIGVLVNNVGMARRDQIAHGFTEFDDDMNRQILICNNYSMTRMCELVLPIMEKQKSGVVINISSIIGTALTPYISMYSASKAFVDAFSECLSQEYSGTGIVFQNVQPNFVQTNFAPEMDKASTVMTTLIAVKAKPYVEKALETVGEQLHTSGHPKHMAWNTFIRCVRFVVPNSVYMFLARIMTNRLRAKIKALK